MMFRSQLVSFGCKRSKAFELRQRNRSIFYSQVFLDYHQHQSYKFFSSNVLGYSPMANAIPVESNNTNPGIKKKRGDFGTVDANTAITGGVWAQTSAKREKLVELKTELKENQENLDDAATLIQKLDLELADGLKVVAKAKDEGWEDYVNAPMFDDFLKWAEECETQLENEDSLKLVDREIFETHLKEVIQKADQLMRESNSTASLSLIRDFMEPSKSMISASESANGSSLLSDDSITTTDENKVITKAFKKTLHLYQSILLKTAAEEILNSWEIITKITDGDLDRAAIDGVEPPKISSLSLVQVNNILKSYLIGSCDDIVSSWWSLIDQDRDGLLDESQMEQVAQRSIEPFIKALPTLFIEAVESHPVTLPLSPVASYTVDNDQLHQSSKRNLISSMGWRQRRKEKKSKKTLLKIFSKTLKNHFIIDVESPHRLRCIYAWADKEHQNNKIESVLLDTGFENTVSVVVGGKKRYVELQPKISLEEFRTEQKDHFPHLDRVGQEIFGSFKEDLHVIQGKGRQNAELRREMALFFAFVCIVDAGISLL